MFKKRLFRLVSLGAVFATVCCVLGCAGRPRSIDPLECLNRGTYAFNKAANRVLINPLARAYEALIPKPVQRMVSNFFQNLKEVPNVANDILQGNFSYARHDTARFIINSTWGFGGIFDAAARGNRLRRHQDFGLTLAKWGYKNSSYLVLPILGPSTVRDTVGLGATYFMWPPSYLKSVSVKNSILALDYIDIKASLLKIEPAISEAVDEYIFIRDAYLQNRQYKMKGITADKGSTGTGFTEPILGEPPE